MPESIYWMTAGSMWKGWIYKKKASMEAFYSTRFKNCLVRSLEG